MKFGSWEELPGGGRRYWFEVIGRSGWKARYVKKVDTEERTLKFYQEIYNDKVSWWRSMRNIRLIRDIRGSNRGVKHDDYPP